MWAAADALYARKDNIPIGEKTRKVSSAIPYGRLALPQEIAAAVLSLASDDAEYVIG